MAKIKVILNRAPVNGKQISFFSPCASGDTEGLLINDVDYTLVDADGVGVSFLPNLWNRGALISVIVDTANRKAYVQNANSNTYLESALKGKASTDDLNVMRSRLDALIAEGNEDPSPFPSYVIDSPYISGTMITNGVHMYINATVSGLDLGSTRYIDFGWGDTFKALCDCSLTCDVYGIHAHIHPGDRTSLLCLSAANSITPPESFRVYGHYILAEAFNAKIVNAETRDIRVGFDGTVYPTAGEAVRSQIAAVTKTNTDLVDKLSPAFSESGSVVTCEPIANYPLEVVSHLENKNLYYNLADNDTTDNPNSGLVIKQIKGESSTLINGTCTSDASVRLVTAFPIKAGTYMVSLHGANKVNSDHDRLYVPVKEGTGVNYVLVGSPKQLTIAKDTTLDVNLIVKAGSTYNNAEVSVQIEKGTVATAYAPYKQFTDVKLTLCGKNLFNMDAALNNVFTKDGDVYAGFFDTAGDRFGKGVDTFIPAGSNIVMSADIIETNTLSGKPLQIQFTYEGGGSFELSPGSAKTLTDNVVRMDIYMESTDIGCYVKFKDVQVEIGTTATAYELYRGNNFVQSNIGMSRDNLLYSASSNQTTFAGLNAIQVKGSNCVTINGQYPSAAGVRITQSLLLKAGTYSMSMYGADVYGRSDSVFVKFTDRSETPTATVDAPAVFTLDADTTVSVFVSTTAAFEYNNAKIYFQINKCTGIDGGTFNWSTGVLTDSKGNTHSLTPRQIMSLSGVNTLFSDTGITEVKGRLDPGAIIDDLKERLAALEAAVVNNL